MRVHVAHQRQGYGTAILAALEAVARQRGFSALILDTSTVQLAAQCLYTKHGFVETHRDTIANFIRIWYRKELSPASMLSAARAGVAT